MPPAKSIFVDSTRMLQSIADIAAEQHADALERTRTWDDWRGRKASTIAEAAWVRRNVGRFSKTMLTPSQAKRWQQRLVEMGDEGLVELTPSHCRLTESGKARLESTNI